MVSPAREHEGQVIELKVLSPSTEVTTDIHFPQLPVTTTVGELKLRIRDTLPTHPDTVRQRLIYRGRVVANDGDNMVSVFGSSALQESKSQTIHLVLRELRASGSATASEASRSSTVSPNPFRSQNVDPTAPIPPPPTNPFRALQPPDTGPQTQPPLFPQPAQPLFHGHTQGLPFHPHPPFPIAHNMPQTGQALTGYPAHFRQMVEQQQRDFQRFLQQQQQQQQRGQADGQGQTGSERNTPGQSRRASPSLDQAQQRPNGTPAQPEPGRSGHIGINPHRRAASAENLQRSSSQPARQTPAPIPTSQPHFTPGISHTVNAAGPNGEQWMMTINNGTMTLPTMPPGSRISTPLQGHPLGPFQPPYTMPAGPPPQDTSLQSLAALLQQVDREIGSLRNTIGGNDNVLPSFGSQALPMQRLAAFQQYERLRTVATDLVATLGEMLSVLRTISATDGGNNARPLSGGQAESIADLRMLAERLQMEARWIELQVNNLVFGAANSAGFNRMPRAASTTGRASSQIASRAASRVASRAASPTRPATTRNVQPILPSLQPSQGPRVYLLSSPEGPRALVMSDQGIFANDNSLARLTQSLGSQDMFGTSSRPEPQVSDRRQSLPGANASANQNNTAANATRGAARRHRSRQAQDQQPGRAPAPQPPQQVQQPPQDRGLAGILGDLGINFRLLWLVVRVGGIMWLFFNGSDWRRPLLVGIAAVCFFLFQRGFVGQHWAEQIRERLERLLNEENVDIEPPQQLQQGDAPDPARLARRLVNQAQAPGWAWLRGVERTVALFIASLWPGVGEQHLAAREEALRRAARLREADAAREQQNAAEGEGVTRAADAEPREEQGELRRRGPAEAAPAEAAPAAL